MLKIKLSIGQDYIDVEGDLPLSDILPVITSWLDALPAAAQRQIDQATARLAGSTTKLAGDVRAATPTSP